MVVPTSTLMNYNYNYKCVLESKFRLGVFLYVIITKLLNQSRAKMDLEQILYLRILNKSSDTDHIYYLRKVNRSQDTNHICSMEDSLPTSAVNNPVGHHRHHHVGQ